MLFVNVNSRKRVLRCDSPRKEIAVDGERCRHVLLLVLRYEHIKIVNRDVVIACNIAVCHAHLVVDGRRRAQPLDHASHRHKQLTALILHAVVELRQVINLCHSLILRLFSYTTIAFLWI